MGNEEHSMQENTVEVQLFFKISESDSEIRT